MNKVYTQTKKPSKILHNLSFSGILALEQQNRR